MSEPELRARYNDLMLQRLEIDAEIDLIREAIASKEFQG
jgi:hypothetical protein